MTAVLLLAAALQEPVGRSAAGVARIGPVAYSVGGVYEANTGWEGFLVAYDLAAKKWARLARLPEPIAFAAVASLGGKLYVFGGLHTDQTHCDHARIYDPVTDRWSDLAKVPTPRSRATATVVQGNIAVIGGIAPESSVGKNSDRVEVYDPKARTWSRLAPLMTARHGHVSEFVKDRLVVAGGYTDDGMTAGTEVWDPGAGWAKGADLPQPRGFASSFVYDGAMWVFGNRGGAPHPVRFDPATGAWTPSAAADSPRHRGGVVEYQGKAYFLFGEEDGGKPLRAFDLRRDAWVD